MDSRKILLIILPLFLWGTSVFAQKEKVLVSPDSTLLVTSYMQDNDHAMVAYSDSCVLKAHGQVIQVRPPVWHKMVDTACFDLADGHTSTCQVFVPPTFTSIHELGDTTYALVGYTTHLPVTFKHIWIVSVNNDLKILKRVSMISDGMKEINFSYDQKKKEILINSRINDIMEDRIYSFGDDLVLTKDGIDISTRTQNINCSIWKAAGEKSAAQHEEIIYRVTF